MKFLAIEKENLNVDWTNTESLLKDEAKAISELYLQGVIREIFFNDVHCAVILMECYSKETALKILGNLPLSLAGMITFDVTELKPYTGFSRLYEKT
jgi:hypothetical protein